MLFKHERWVNVNVTYWKLTWTQTFFQKLDYPQFDNSLLEDVFINLVFYKYFMLTYLLKISQISHLWYAVFIQKDTPPPHETRLK